MNLNLVRCIIVLCVGASIGAAVPTGAGMILYPDHFTTNVYSSLIAIFFLVWACFFLIIDAVNVLEEKIAAMKK